MRQLHSSDPFINKQNLTNENLFIQDIDYTASLGVIVSLTSAVCQYCTRVHIILQNCILSLPNCSLCIKSTVILWWNKHPLVPHLRHQWWKHQRLYKLQRRLLSRYTNHRALIRCIYNKVRHVYFDNQLVLKFEREQTMCQNPIIHRRPLISKALKRLCLLELRHSIMPLCNYDLIEKQQRN